MPFCFNNIYRSLQVLYFKGSEKWTKVLRLGFHLARKPFSGFSNGGSEFKMETLIPAAGLGLKNLGNTYFLNSVLQFLTYTECLDAYFLDVSNVKRFHVTGFCALCAMQRHVRTTLQASGGIAAPSLKLRRIFTKVPVDVDPML
ncbi:hypothetical protein F2Q70_00012538 [Brassica cretica]|uniref:Peptidase C19 ubiquitin carboxyl-terminal hydrolase domain-containing protein n=1 Tax=Brassica cretica TaxID=69181 RepID=A0A8S9M2Z2_BRACR|nr:hypothetical protein F2Q70_00012538 [Brassica cretica]